MVRTREPVQAALLFLRGSFVDVLLSILNGRDSFVDGIDGVGHAGAVVR